MTTLAHISDLHFGRLDRAAAEALPNDLFAQRPDLLIVSGDLTQRARSGQYRDAIDFLKKLPHPQLLVPGNHDVPLYDILRRWTDPYGRFRQLACDDLFPVWTNDETLVVGVNTACRFALRFAGFWKDGKIRPEHLERLKELVAQHDPNGQRVRILAAHHPFIEPPGGHQHGIVHGAGDGLVAIEQLNFDLILGGHLHLSFQEDVRAQHPHLKRRMVNLLAGSATSTRRREEFCSYNLIKVENGDWTATVRRFSNGKWQ